MGYIYRVASGGARGILKQVNASNDDGHWYGSTCDKTSGLLAGYNTTYPMNSWARWSGIDIPNGVTILSAYVDIKISSFVGTSCGFYIYFNDVRNPTYPTTAAVADAKTLTSNYAGPCYYTTTGWKTIDVLSIIQELYASYKPYTNDEMMALFKGTGSGANYGWMTSYDNSPANAPILRITW